jgi:hypothetical protein
MRRQHLAWVTETTLACRQSGYVRSTKDKTRGQTDTTDECGSQGLQGCENLKVLHVGSNSMTDTGFARLCGALSGDGKCALQSIDVEWNAVRDVAPLVKCIESNENLR